MGIAEYPCKTLRGQFEGQRVMVWQYRLGILAPAALAGGMLILGGGDSRAADAGDSRIVISQQASAAEPAKPPESAGAADSLEARMARRFPQKIKVGDLIGLPMLDDDDVTLGHVQQVVRSPEGKIRLIVSYSKWFGWFGRPVAVPIEAVAILAKQIASLEMQPAEYESAPTWMAGTDRAVPDGEIIRIAVTRR
jgi:hypothetical protein